MQVFDQVVKGLPVLFFDLRHAPKAAGAFGVAAGFRGRDRLLVFTDPVVDMAAPLGEQPAEVVSLELIRPHGRRRALHIAVRPVHDQRRHGPSLTYIDGFRADRAAVGPTPASIAGATHAVPGDRAGTLLAGQTGEVHVVSFGCDRAFGVRNNNPSNSTSAICADD
jgi:hypothetical protein